MKISAINTNLMYNQMKSQQKNQSFKGVFCYLRDEHNYNGEQLDEEIKCYSYTPFKDETKEEISKALAKFHKEHPDEYTDGDGDGSHWFPCGSATTYCVSVLSPMNKTKAEYERTNK